MTLAGRFNYGVEREKIKLDIKDKRIISLLLKDSRTPLTVISKKVRLSRDAVTYRIKRLKNEGVIKGFFPVLNFEALGFNVFHVFFLVEEKNAKERKVFIEYLRKSSHCLRLIEYTDRWDFEAVFLAQNVYDFDETIINLSKNFPDLIIEKEMVETIKRFYVKKGPMGDIEEDFFKESVGYERVLIDETDRKILSILSQDARIAYYDIAYRLGISSDTVRYRVNNLKKKKVLLSFTTLIDYSALSYQWYTFSLNMNHFDHSQERILESFLTVKNELVGSIKTIGAWDLLLYITVENQKAFHEIVKGIKKQFSSSIKNYDAWIAYKEHFFNPMPDVMCKDLERGT